MITTNLMWFRNDLRLADNPALTAACVTKAPLALLYIFDESAPLTEQPGSASRWWLHQSLQSLGADCQKMNATLILRRGEPLTIFKDLTATLSLHTVFWNESFEPAARKRDELIKQYLAKQNITAHIQNGQLLFHPRSIHNQQHNYYKVYTSFKQSCLKSGLMRELLPVPTAIDPCKTQLKNETLTSWHLLPEKPNWAEKFSTFWHPGESGAQLAIEKFFARGIYHYTTGRDQPALAGTSKLSPHLHFGEISPWQVWHYAKHMEIANRIPNTEITKFLSELLWREFSAHLLYHFEELPYQAFKTEFNSFPWQANAMFLKAWQQGQTGYPLVDAGMRELWQTGWMHNRVRMVVASFLIKHLLQDWRSGAAWFWDTLLDADLANNSASWQWVAGSGADSAPFFRIFNPVLQSQKFDTRGDYLRRYLPELAGLRDEIHAPWQASKATLEKAGVALGQTYPFPIVKHEEARKRALLAHKHAKTND